MSNNSRPVYEQPIYKIIIPVRDLSLNEAVPQFAAAIDAQIDCDDASDDFITEKLHSNIHSSNTDSMTYATRSPYHHAARMQPPIEFAHHHPGRRNVIGIRRPIVLSVRVEKFREHRHKRFIRPRALDRIAHLAAERQVLERSASTR
jgi:hypothetical protein